MSYKDCFNKPAKDWESAIMGMETSKLLKKMSEQKDFYTNNGIEWTKELLEELVAFVRDNDQWGHEPAVHQFIQSKMQKVYPEGILSFKMPTSGVLQIFDAKMWEFYGGYQEWVKQLTEANYLIWTVENKVYGERFLSVGDTVHYSLKDVRTGEIYQHVPTVKWKIARFIISSNNDLLAQSENKANVEQICDLKKILEEKTFTLSEVREKISNAARHIFNDDIYFKILKEFE